MDSNRWRKWRIHTARKLDDLASFVNSVNLERLDREHERLLRQVLLMRHIAENNMTLADNLHRHTLAIETFLNDLEEHFDTELEIIKKYSLGNGQDHSNQHDLLRKKTLLLANDLKQGVISNFRANTSLIIDELIIHINSYDKKCFSLQNFHDYLLRATDWQEVREIIKTTGVPFVDEEHKILTKKILTLKSSSTKTATKKDLIKKIIDIHDYAEKHFNHEIDFLKRHKLDSKTQQKSHSIFLKKTTAAIKSLNIKKEYNLEPFIIFLLEWWITHINIIDYQELHISRFIDFALKNTSKADEFDWIIRSTGVEKIDQEHQDILHEILLLTSYGQGPQALVELQKGLEKLFVMVTQHFKDEEELIKAMNIPGVEAHTQTHNLLLKNAEESLKHILTGRAKISSSFQKKLLMRLIDHTNGMDYEAFVLSKKEKGE